ncbi:MAG: fused MFS/spermidine synthase, partial [Candidatus Sumerlaeia bacterium]|nr:fused MFS/spermidine synthase [Candidatus Sumerlaeia bacterium]
MTDSTRLHDPQPLPALPSARLSAVWVVAVYGLFFLSGMTSLIYEVLWVRKFGLVFGVTTYAVSTVLAAFFAGLAVGSFLAGRLIDRTRVHPLCVYGGMEAVIGLYALMLPHFLDWVENLYPVVYESLSESFGLFTLFRFAVCFALLAVPTTLMGATLPVLSKLLVSRETQLGVNVGRLYAVNTFGAVAGTAGAGFFLLPTFGVPETTLITAGGNFVLAAGAVLLSRVPAFRAVPERTAAFKSERFETSDSTDRPLALFLAFISGLTILALEVVWTRSLILILGSTTYAFSIMLTAVLVGIALGSAVFAHVADRVKQRAVWAGMLLFLGGACAVFGPAVMNRLPFVFLRLYDWAEGRWTLILVAQFAVCFLLVFIPTFFSGGSFPLLVRLHSRGESRVGRTVADVYAMNTVGGIVGSLLGGFVLVRSLGLQPALTVAALTLMALGGVPAVALARGRGSGVARTGVAAAMLMLVVALGVFHPRFDTKLLFGGWGPFAGGYNAGRTTGTTVDVTDRHMSRLLYHKEGVSASVDAIETAWGDRILSINAQPVATTYLWDLRLLKMIGHLPVLLHDNPQDALVIGMGAGVAAGVMAGYASLREVTVVELSEEVPGGAAQFAGWNYDVLNNPKLRIVINDGANYVKAVRKQFDLIGSDPIHPFLLGNGTLYSVEHWQACRDRLREGGVLVQWLPMYQLSAEDFATVIRTFAEAFPNATVWYSGIDVILIGIKGERRIDLDRMAAHMRDETMRADLISLGAAEPSDVLGWLVGGPLQIEKIAARGAVNRLDYPVLEFTAPKAILLRGVSATIPLLIDAVNQTSDTEFCRLVEALVKGPQPQAVLDAAVVARHAQYWV